MIGEGHIISGSQSQFKAMTVPYSNQVFVAGQFNDALTMENIEINSPESNNVYLGYLKDDTWLNSSIIHSHEVELYPNPFNQSFHISSENKFKELEIYTLSGVLIEKYSDDNAPLSIGDSWNSGVYMIKFISESDIYTFKKVVKIH
jgi:hypothetical protein